MQIISHVLGGQNVQEQAALAGESDMQDFHDSGDVER